MLRQKIALLGLNLLHKRKKIACVKFLDRFFYVFPGVFDPRYVLTSKFFAKNLDVKNNDVVLDMGTGAGILAIFAAEKARKVIAVDINKNAVECARANAALNGLEKKIDARRSNLFSNIREKFDLILFNPPYLRGKAKTILEKAWFDGGVVLKFLKEAKGRLKKNGRIEILYSSIAGKEAFEQNIRKLGYNFKITARKDMLFERFLIYELSNI